MRVHILGVAGTFMAGIARLGKQAGHAVSGSDLDIYPPMSTQLLEEGIVVHKGYHPDHLNRVDCVIVGNVIKRGNPAIEYVLNKNIPFFSGPEWLAQFVLKGQHVLAVAGTHGKTTTTSLLTWILEEAGLDPGFLIGGIPENFGISARKGAGNFFVVEADEYDSAFFDKRSKFVHYHPRTLILNNLEFDHADIFPNLAAIQQQFHHLVRTVRGEGLIVLNGEDLHLQAVIEQGCWTPLTYFGGKQAEWTAALIQADGSAFSLFYRGQQQAEIEWNLLGRHNVCNALAAIAAAHHINIPAAKAARALTTFKNVKRRLQQLGVKRGITIYDDFAHHPTAIAATLAGLRAKIGKARLIVALELGSYTMRSGVHSEALPQALEDADVVFCKKPAEINWDVASILKKCSQPTGMFEHVDDLLKSLLHEVKRGDHIVVMSNTGFGGIHQRLLDAIES